MICLQYCIKYGRYMYQNIMGTLCNVNHNIVISILPIFVSNKWSYWLHTHYGTKQNKKFEIPPKDIHRINLKQGPVPKCKIMMIQGHTVIDIYNIKIVKKYVNQIGCTLMRFFLVNLIFFLNWNILFVKYWLNVLLTNLLAVRNYVEPHGEYLNWKWSKAV